MKNLTKNISTLISALVILVVGILCIVAGAASGETSANAYEGISMTLGISLIVVAGLVLVLALVASIATKGKASFLATAIGSSATLALGIFFVSDKSLGGQLIWLFLNFVPFVLLVVGSIIVADGILNIVFGIVNKNAKVALISSVMTLVVGAISIILGALMVGNDPVITKSAQLIIFGIVIIFFAFSVCATACLDIFVKKNINNTKKDSIDAEVNEVNQEESNEANA